ncbi:hypothetical protein [Kutzneria buriramensis]|uniref:hypothetical protein n=1 Tax=Streptomyces sp. NL15-2K TaxID=376149 RepID=UPI0026F253AB|nr:hypothetical protein [Kutzneria buriramensis]WKX14228.1 hypothetical protein Q4V64_44615 [Kutzneria buriramensis]
MTDATDEPVFPHSPDDPHDPRSADNVVNKEQAAAWNGYEGRHWADHQDRYDALNDGANTPLLDAAALTSTDRVLDIGCCNGRTTRLAAARAAYALACWFPVGSHLVAHSLHESTLPDSPTGCPTRSATCPGDGRR